MDWLHTLSIIATVMGSAYYVHRDIKEDMKTQTSRTDRLYEMFCDLQKQMCNLQVQMKDEMIDMKKEQYEFMRERK